MAALTRRGVVAALALAGCGDVVGFGGTPTPLATIQVATSGDVPAGATLRAALVWGAQWLPEPFCILPAESDAAAAVISAGCPDSFGFVPARVGASAPVGQSLKLFDLPAADVMIGDVTARVAYGSLVVFDDRNGSGTLELRRAAFAPDEGQAPDAGVPDGGPQGPADVVYGASFVSMTQPDQRLGYREGGFDAGAAFYPRSGCPAPPPGFSLLAAGGFTAQAALSAALSGTLPAEDPATCATATLDTTVTVAMRAPADVAQLACQRGSGGTTRYRAPPSDAPDLAGRTWACAHLPRLGSGSASDMLQLVVAGPPDNACKGLLHYTLRGCNNDPTCATPAWDRTASPPSWWPCK
jgi:hypothetical protein